MSEAMVDTDSTSSALKPGTPSQALESLVSGFPVHLTVEQLGQMLGVATKTAYEYLQAGDVPSYRIGKRWIILRDEVRDFLVAMRVK